MLYIYFLRGPDNLVKIGVTKNISNRLGSMTNLPFAVHLHHVIEDPHARKLERNIHRYFKEDHVNGEWFRLSDEQFKLVSDTNAFLIEINRHNNDRRNKSVKIQNRQTIEIADCGPLLWQILLEELIAIKGGITYEDMAAELGLTYGGLYRIINGPNMPRTTNFLQMLVIYPRLLDTLTESINILTKRPA